MAKHILVLTRQEWETIGKPNPENPIQFSAILHGFPELRKKAVVRGKYHAREEKSYNQKGSGKHATYRN